MFSLHQTFSDLLTKACFHKIFSMRPVCDTRKIYRLSPVQHVWNFRLSAKCWTFPHVSHFNVIFWNYTDKHIDRMYYSGFFSWGGGGGRGQTGRVPPSGKNFVNPPHLTLVPIFGPKLVPPPAEVCPPKFEKFKYIFVSNLTTFKLKKYLKKLYIMLKIAKWPNFA